MRTLRPATQRGTANFGWLDSRHTFSFGHYYDPAHMGFGPLRVINEDKVIAGRGFETHSHQDMEILSYVIDGALAHKDSMGTGSVIRPGQIQRMTAGTGVQHSEFNHSDTDPVHFLQIWILPDHNGLTPGYEEQTINANDKHDRLALIGSSGGGNGAVKIHQDVDLYATTLTLAHRVNHTFAQDRYGWLQLISGQIDVDGQVMATGDGLALADPGTVNITALEPAELLLFDMMQ